MSTEVKLGSYTPYTGATNVRTVQYTFTQHLKNLSLLGRALLITVDVKSLYTPGKITDICDGKRCLISDLFPHSM